MNFKELNAEIKEVAIRSDILDKSIDVARFITSKVEKDIEVLAILHNVELLVSHILEEQYGEQVEGEQVE